MKTENDEAGGDRGENTRKDYRADENGNGVAHNNGSGGRPEENGNDEEHAPQEGEGDGTTRGEFKAEEIVENGYEEEGEDQQKADDGDEEAAQ